MSAHSMFSGLCALLALTACYARQALPVPDGGAYDGTSSAGVPCDVAAVLRRNCYGCHTSSRTVARLVSYVDLTRPSRSDPTKTVIERSVELMRATAPQMPPRPSPRVPEADIALVEAWASSGAPRSTCGDDAGVFDAGPSEYDTPSVCTSGTQWTGAYMPSPEMIPGGACISCHRGIGEGPLYAVAGTVYPTAHEPEDCNGADGTGTDGAVVVVRGANLVEYVLPTNVAGNFFLMVPDLSFPYTARVEYQGRVREMVSTQLSGDCNACHTERGGTTLDGGISAPGRIVLP